jgi:APA family basic amino acid/polyamine antiporter
MAIKAKLTTFDTTMIVVSLVIGIGIFRTPAMVAEATKTPFLFFTAWILGGLISLLGALTFAEIGSRFAKPGAYYKVVAESYHSSLAFMFNWAGILIANGAGAAAVGLIGAEYLTPIVFPPEYQTQLTVQVTTAVLILFLFIINYLGIKTGAWAQNVLTLLKVAMILMLVFTAFRYQGPPVNAAENAAPNYPFWLALGVGLIAVFYTQGGYQNTINFGADMKQARRNMPRAILYGILIILACYFLINIAYVKVLGVPGIAGAKLVAAEVAFAIFGRFGYLFVSLVIFFSAMGFLNATFLQLPRAYYAMAEDKTLPEIFMKVNQRTQAQEFTLVFFTATVLLSLVFLGTFENIVDYVMFVDALSIAVVASTLFVLRRKAKQQDKEYKGYRVPLYPLVPAVFILFLIFVSMNVLWTNTRSALLGTAIFASGYPIFLFMRRLRKKTPSNKGTVPW